VPAHPIDVAAARQLPLPAVLRRLHAVQDKNDKRKWRTSEGVISITGSKFFNWNRGTGGGGAIDLVMHLQHCDFKIAVLWLSDQFSCTGIDQSEHTTYCGQSALRLPERDNAKLPAILQYLALRRCIPSNLIKLVVDSETLYADARTNAVFLLLGKEKTVVGAELRGTTSRCWRGMALGSRKDLGYFSISGHDPKNVILCESAIDAISCFALHPDSLVISTSGAHPNPPWLKDLIAQEQEISCGYDSDDCGNTTAEKMLQLHPAIRRLRPSKHDWNDVLAYKSPYADLNHTLDS